MDSRRALGILIWTVGVWFAAMAGFLILEDSGRSAARMERSFS